MGKLTDLVKYRNELANAVNSLNLHNTINKKINAVARVQDDNTTVSYNVDDIINNYKQLIVDNDNNISKINELIVSINADIDRLANELFSNRKLLDNTSRIDTLADSEFKLTIKSKIRQHCDWHYPGLQISCNSKEFIDCMVAADPLYLTDSLEDRAVHIKLNELISLYPQQYQNRLRLYSIDGHDFSKLPVAQFSFILCWNFLDYVELDSLAEYMRQMFALLRPGGVFMFSYNNCDTVDSARLAESNEMSWTSARAIKQLCSEIGYDVILLGEHSTENVQFPYISWAELQKPGKLTTVKAHQVAGKILEK